MYAELSMSGEFGACLGNGPWLAFHFLHRLVHTHVLPHVPIAEAGRFEHIENNTHRPNLVKPRLTRVHRIDSSSTVIYGR